jgi:hypothetical protein
MSMAFLPEEDAATIGAGDVAAAIESGAVSATQPGLVAPAETPEPVVPPVDPYAAKRGYYVASSEVVTEGGRKIQVITDYNGRVTRTDIGAADAADEDDEDGTTEDAATAFAREQAGQRRENAFAVISAFLQRAGLAGLEGNIRTLLAQGIEDSDAILFSLRDTEQFRTRFKANAARAKKGLPELDPATYIGLEQQYASTLRSNRLPTGFYDQPDDFNALIEGDVSPQELQARISEGFAKVRDADPEVRRQMQTLYGVGSDEQLAAYFLDPEKGIQALQREAQAAAIAARGREQAGFQLTAATAEDLARRGITEQGALTAFQRAGELAGLYQEMGGEEALTQEQKVGAAFGFDVAAQRELELRQRRRLAEFQGGGQFARTTGATSGTVETGVGTAQ